MKNDNNIEKQHEEIPFDLPVENELLMLKLKAEFGAECATGHQDIPPVVVNEFLKSVYEFEQKFREPCRQVSVYEKIGKPFFKRAKDLGPGMYNTEIKRITKLLNAHGVELDILGEYEDLLIYQFLTEEFFYFEMDDLELPGYMHHFCYEDFHPNHELDIRQLSIEFIDQWFGRKVDEYSRQFGGRFIHPDTRLFSKEQVLKKIRNMFDAYPVFSHGEYSVTEISFKWDERKQSGSGSAEGWLSYEACSEGKEWVRFEGPFTFYFSNEDNWWGIYYFIFPGFSWNG